MVTVTIYSTRRMRTFFATVLLCAAALAQAEPYPAKPIHLIVPFPPGGGNDTVARALAQQLGPDLGQPVIIDNRPGAGGAVGAELAAKAPPDGYTLFLAGVGSHAVNPNLQARLAYDPVRDFTPITLLASAPSVLVVNPAVPSLAESGLPDYEAGSWYGVMAPAGTSRELVERLHGAIVRALKEPDVA